MFCVYLYRWVSHIGDTVLTTPVYNNGTPPLVCVPLFFIIKQDRQIKIHSNLLCNFSLCFLEKLFMSS